MVAPIYLFLLSLFLFNGCSFFTYPLAVHTPKDPDPKHIKHEEFVQHCEYRGKIKTAPPYVLPSDWQEEFIKQSRALKANAYYAKAPDFTKRKPTIGHAYYCR